MDRPRRCRGFFISRREPTQCSRPQPQGPELNAQGAKAQIPGNTAHGPSPKLKKTDLGSRLYEGLSSITKSTSKIFNRQIPNPLRLKTALVGDGSPFRSTEEIATPAPGSCRVEKFCVLQRWNCVLQRWNLDSVERELSTGYTAFMPRRL